eukprot:GHVP01031466.1.p1 GENE.GHVP01031466.1~~GHVP01031466.1.p1  ORF type:complete len:530 (+),score=43.28 GHVP01031466.1:64-1590(+)
MRVWYPSGRNIGENTYPGLMIICYGIWKILNTLSIQLSILKICLFIPVLCGCLTIIGAYFLGSILYDEKTGNLAAYLLAISGGHIDKTKIGNYDYESLGMVFMIYSFLFWNIGLQHKRKRYISIAGLLYGLMAWTWGGHVFCLNIITLNAVILCMKNKSMSVIREVYILFLFIGVLLSDFCPVVHKHLLKSFFYTPSIILVLLAISNSKIELIILPLAYLFEKGVNVDVRYRFIFRYFHETTEEVLAKSISENQNTTLKDVLVDVGPMFFMLFFHAHKIIKDKFILTYFLLSLYAAGTMLRFVFLLCPVVSILLGSILSELSNRHYKKGVILYILLFLNAIFISYHFHSNSIMQISAVDQFKNTRKITDAKEGFLWLKNNTPIDSVILAWWNHGYHIGTISERTTFIDNNTSSSERISEIASIFLSSFTEGVGKGYDAGANYIFVMCGKVINYRNDDTSQIGWMRRMVNINIQKRVFLKELCKGVIHSDKLELVKKTENGMVLIYRYK